MARDDRHIRALRRDRAAWLRFWRSATEPDEVAEAREALLAIGAEEALAGVALAPARKWDEDEGGEA